MRNVILGISAYYHDSAAVLIVDGKVVAAAQEERFTRQKHDAGFPKHAVEFCLEDFGIALNDLDAIVFYDKPLLKFERLLETYYAFAPKGVVSFLKAMPVWLKEKLFLRKLLRNELKNLGTYSPKKTPLLFTEHHLSHAASAFYPSGFDEAAILVIDGVGEWSTASIAKGAGKTIKVLKEMQFPHSVGLLYSAFTYYLGFKVNSGEYKLMGLAPYGDENSAQTQHYIQIINGKLIQVFEDGSIHLDQKYFNYATGLRMVKDFEWAKLLGLKRREPEAEITQEHCNLALAIQITTEEIVLKMVTTAKAVTGATKLCMAGGVALNCVANGKVLKSGLFEEIFIQPAAGDAGGAVGGALAAAHMYFDLDVRDNKEVYLGPSYTSKEIERLINKVEANAEHFDDREDLNRLIAHYFGEGKVIGWFQGRMEFGPRALGNRSIIADPARPEMQQKVNLKIKEREGFRPFAPSVLREDCSTFFELETESPYMLFTAPIQKNQRKTVAGTKETKLQERVKEMRSSIPAVTHVDYSARIQTVEQKQNERFYALLKAIKKETGRGIVLNTSFNVRGEPIVCTPFEAYRCFMATDMDVLVLEDFVFVKEHQNGTKEMWKMTFGND